MSKYFLPYQQRYLADTSTFKIVEKSRRIGFTYVQSYEDTREAAAGEWDVWFSSADESAAKEYIEYCGMWAKVLNLAASAVEESVIHDEKDIKVLSIRFASGKRINALSSSPKAFRSKGGKVVLDEFAFHEQAKALWKAASPARLWGFPIRVISTHNGTSSLYNEFVTAAKEGRNKASLHTVTLQDAVDDGLVDKIVKRAATEADKKAFIEECRSIAGDDESFDEEFGCAPADGAKSFLPYELLATVQLPKGELLWPSHEIPETAGTMYLGMDIGRRKDLSVIWIDEKIGPLTFTRAIVTLHKMKFALQREMLYSFLKDQRVQRACIDETGIGMQLAEEAVDEFGESRVEGITITGAAKKKMAFDLKAAFEGREKFIPSDPSLAKSFNSVKRSITVAGNERFEGGTDESHADDFWACALATHAADGDPGPLNFASGSRLRSEALVRNYMRAHRKPLTTLLSR